MIVFSQGHKLLHLTGLCVTLTLSFRVCDRQGTLAAKMVVAVVIRLLHDKDSFALIDPFQAQLCS